MTHFTRQTPQAWSIGDRWFDMEAPVASALPVGSYVLVTCDDGRRFLGQLTAARVSSSSSGRTLLGGGTMWAASNGDGWTQPTGLEVFDDARVEAAPPAVVDEWLGASIGPRTTLDLGRRRGEGQGGPVRLMASGFNRHTFLCGQSGSGKTYALGLLLEELLLKTEIRIVVLDPNSDYVHLGDMVPADDEEASRIRDLAGRICVFRSEKGPHRLRVRFGRYALAMQALLLELDAVRDEEQYDALRRAGEAMPDGEYSLADLRRQLEGDADPAARRLALRIDNLGLQHWSIWAERDEKPLLDQLPGDWRAAVIDLGELGSPQERSAISAAILAGLWNRRHDREPVLVVLDEAHNVCPARARDPQQALAVEHAVNIAAEGRKFGLYLLLATQRPAKLDVDVVTQCDNLVLMRMNSSSDIEHLVHTFSQFPAALIEQASGFELGEGLVAGQISAAPTLFRSGRRRSPEGGRDVATTWSKV
jgi:uncharacterized protein